MDDEVFRRRVCDRIRHLRQTHRLTQEQLSLKAQLSEHYVSQIESHSSLPSLLTCYRIATALGLSLSELLEGIDGRDFNDSLREKPTEIILYQRTNTEKE